MQAAEKPQQQNLTSQLDHMILRQEEFFDSGATRSLDFRLSQLTRFKQRLLTEAPNIYAALQRDLGKSEREAYITEFSSVIHEIDFFLTRLPRLVRSKRVTTPIFLWPSKSYMYHEPLGRVLIISPWNYPFLLSLVPLIGAVAAGNCVVLKPSEISQHSSQLMQKIVGECFNPAHVTVTLGGAEESMELLRSPWGHVFFTGSPQVGQVVARACAEHLTPMTLELGGKSPVMVTQNANLTIAARRIIYGKGLNAGQTCVAPDYVLVHSDMKEALIQKLKDQIQIQYGESLIHCGEYGRIVSTRHFDRLIDLLKNCKILAGGRHTRDQRFMELTLVDEPDAQARISKEEIFGPLLPIYSYQNFQEAIKLLKSRPKPLAAYIFSENRSEISQFVSEFSFGGGCVNDTIVHPSNSNLKFGGIAASGIGSYNAHQSFRTFSHAKPIVDSLTSVDLSIRYLPAKSWKYKLLRLVK